MEKIVTDKVSKSLVGFLNWTKRSNTGLDYDSVHAYLAPLYHSEMNIMDVVSIVSYAWTEALMEPRFRMGASKDTVIRNLLVAPVLGPMAVTGPLRSPKSTDKFEIQEFYKSLITTMLIDIRLTRIDWLFEEEVIV